MNFVHCCDSRQGFGYNDSQEVNLERKYLFLGNYYRPRRLKSKGLFSGVTMEREDYCISREQCRIFARSIYKYISAYIQQHKAEFEKYVREEKENENPKEEKGHGSH